VFILRTLTTWHCPQSNAAAAARQAAIYDRYLLPTTPTAANLQQRFAAVRLRWGDIHTDRQRGGHRTVTYRSCSTYYAGSASNVMPLTTSLHALIIFSVSAIIFFRAFFLHLVSEVLYNVSQKKQDTKILSITCHIYRFSKFFRWQTQL